MLLFFILPLNGVAKNMDKIDNNENVFTAASSIIYVDNISFVEFSDDTRTAHASIMLLSNLRE